MCLSRLTAVLLLVLPLAAVAQEEQLFNEKLNVAIPPVKTDPAAFISSPGTMARTETTISPEDGIVMGMVPTETKMPMSV